MKIGFVGIGRMGLGMARNLIRAGHELTVYNRTREKTEALASDGARVVDSPAGTCRGTEAAFTMLSDDHAVAEVVFGENGIASALKPGAAHISSSTISTRFAKRLTEEHGRKQQVYLTACVFGRPEAAEAQKLIVIAGGESGAVERYRPLFDAIGRHTFVVGSEPWQARIQAAFHIERRSQRPKDLLFELDTPVWGAEVGQGNPNRQSRITEGAEEAHVEGGMAREFADLKAPVAFVSPCASQHENSKVRDHTGARELLRRSTRWVAARLTAAAELFLRRAHSSAKTLVGSDTTSVFRMVATLQSWPTAATAEQAARGQTGESSKASKSGGRFSCASLSRVAKALALPCDGRVNRLRECSARIAA